MRSNVQVKIDEIEFEESHEKKLSSVISRIEEIVPEHSKVDGRIVGTSGRYEGRIHIRTRIGEFVARAKAKNIFSLIAKLQGKILRQLVNWREKLDAKRKYQRRKTKLELV